MINFAAEFPSFRERRVDFPVREFFFAANSSVAIVDGRPAALVNVIDQFWNGEIFEPFAEGQNPRIPCNNLTYLVGLDDDLAVTSSTELKVPVPPMTPWPFRGFECPRLFMWHGAPYMAACSHSAHGAPGARFFTGRIEGDRIERVRHIHPNFPAPVEKNWMPDTYGSDRLRFHYHPGVLIDSSGGKLHRAGGEDLKHLHGGTQVVPYGPNNKLCIVHAYVPIPDTTRKQSRQHFILMDKTGRPLKLSEAFEFAGAETEVAIGMAYHPNGRELIISYGRTVADSTMPYQERPFIATVALDELNRRIQL